MKSLSILLLLATASSIVIGALFAVTPVAAGTSVNNSDFSAPTIIQSPEIVAEPQVQIEVEAAALEDIQEVVEAAAPEISSIDVATEIATTAETVVDFDPGTLMSAAFTDTLEKESIPVTSAELDSEAVLSQSVEAVQVNDLASFIDSVSYGSSTQVTGVYVDGALALNVGQQPSGSPGYISNSFGEVTQFNLASAYGSLGLLAHNYLSGNDFFKLSEGQIVTVVYGNGYIDSYKIQEIRRFEALQPNSAYSQFIDLDFGGQLSSSDLFHQMYNSDNSLVLQTCIANNGISTWGRVFVIATPVLS